MAKRKGNKTTILTVETVEKRPKPAPLFYEHGTVKMLSSMITNERQFKRIWGVRLKGQRLDDAWVHARDWRSKFD